MKTVEQGAATSVFLAASAQVEGIGGRYFEDCGAAEVVEQIDGITAWWPTRWTRTRLAGLWDVSDELISSARTAA
jgi:hypothetical protein